MFAAARFFKSNCPKHDSVAQASGLARRIAGAEDEEFKGDVTDACVIDRGNGEYQVHAALVRLCFFLHLDCFCQAVTGTHYDSLF